jgi:hypothetical protein
MTESVACSRSVTPYCLSSGPTSKWDEFVAYERGNALILDSDMCGNLLNFNAGQRGAPCLSLFPEHSTFANSLNFLGPYLIPDIVRLVVTFSVLLNTETCDAC